MEEWERKTNVGFTSTAESSISTDHDQYNIPGPLPVLRIDVTGTLKGKDSIVKSTVKGIIKSVDTGASFW